MFGICLIPFSFLLLSAPIHCAKHCTTDLEQKMELRHENYMTGTLDNFTLFLRVHWNTSGNGDFDGFAFKMMENDNVKRVNTPADDCQIGKEHVWMRTNNRSVCDSQNNTKEECDIISLSDTNFTCKCHSKRCALLPKLDCRGIQTKINPKYFLRSIKYFTLPKTRRNMTFKIDFDVHYKLEYTIYRGNYYQPLKHLSVDFDQFCSEIVSDHFKIPFVEATEKCCESGYPYLKPNVSNVREFAMDQKTKTFNATVSWSTAYSDASREFFLRVSPTKNINSAHYPAKTEVTSLPEANSNMTSCKNDLQIHTATLYNLYWNLTYSFHLETFYGKKPCSSCKQVIKFNTDFDLCKKWNPCKDGETCEVHSLKSSYLLPTTSCLGTAGKENLTKIVQNMHYCAENAGNLSVTSGEDNEIKCTCPDGLSGDGISLLYNGTGCQSNRDACPILNDCDDMATCENIDANSTDYKCRCEDYMYGDGLKTGTGCRPTSLWIASIVLPVLLGMLILLGFIVWCLCAGKGKPKNRTPNETNL